MTNESKAADFEPSLKDKVGTMNGIALKIAAVIDKDKELVHKLSDEESDELYGIADGLTEEFIMRMISGRTSIAAMQRWTPEKLEDKVDQHMESLKKMAEKLSIKIGERLYDHHLPEDQNGMAQKSYLRT